MNKKFIALALGLLLALPVTSNAVDMTGKYGFGYFNTDAPVGGRVWLTPQLGLDLGVGLEMTDVFIEGESESATSFWVEAGFPYVVFPTERANFFVRPGVVFASLDNRVYGGGDMVDAAWTKVTISGTLGAEVFFGDHFSLEAGHGIAVDLTSIPDEEGIANAGESITTIRTFDASIAYLGFHFYFK